MTDYISIIAVSLLLKYLTFAGLKLNAPQEAQEEQRRN